MLVPARPGPDNGGVMGRYCAVLILAVLLASLCSETSAAPPDAVTAPAVVHPKTRLWPSPSGGIEAEYNPPSLLWPVARNARYSVRLSQSADFTGSVISEEDIPFAIFNPHRQLAKGLWYWQYKSDNGAWSESQCFAITEQTPLFVTADAQALVSLIPAARPRILVRPEQMDEFRKRANSYRETQDILRIADHCLTANLPREQDALPKVQGRNDRENHKLAIDSSKKVGNEVFEGIMSLAQAYVLTGNQKYAAAGRNWLMEVSQWDPQGATSPSDFAVSKIMVAMAVGLDTFGGVLTEPEKSALRLSASVRARDFYGKWINSLEFRAFSAHVWQYILHQFIQTSISLMGEIPEAEQWLAYAYELWIARAPVLGRDDGAWANGASYFHLNTLTLLDVPAIFQDLTGINFMRSEWYRNNPAWLLYAFPPHGTCDGFGNGSEKLLKQDLSLIAYADALSRVTHNPDAARYADACLAGTGWDICEDAELRWYRIQRAYLKQRPVPAERSDLPDARIFPDAGVAYLHSDLGSGASNLMVAMRSSPFGSMSHMHANQNTFNIAYGGQRLFFNTGYRPAMGDPHYLGWFKHTQGHNGILIDGKGQPQEAGDAYGWIPRFLHGSRISYAAGDASNAYSSVEGRTREDAGLTRFRRHILMLRPSIVVIYDELEADHDAEWIWLIHSYNKMDVDEKEVTMTAHNAVARGQVSLFGSVPLRCHLSDQFTVKPENWRDLKDEDGDVIEYHDQWHFRGVTEQNTARMRYLAIIQVLPKEPQNAFGVIKRSESRRDFAIGDWLVEAEMQPDKPAAIRARKTDETAAFVSSGTITLCGKEYGGAWTESSKLVEIVENSPLFWETVDELPESMKAAEKATRRSL